ncbi:MAG: HEAT repeat domain-containing protein [Planctomycetes bacterium]|nr:HEAT repeat domain-containing protein [Planctomycetota bacterium]
MVRHLSALIASAIIFALTLSPTAAGQAEKQKEDPQDPVFDGKKASEWVDTLRNGTSARQRALAVEALSKLWIEKRYEEAIPNIGRALRVDSSAAVRTQAAIAMGGLRETEIKLFIADKNSLGVVDMVDAMGMEKESRVRKELAKAIGRFPVVAKLAVVQLTGALKDPDASTRVAIAEALTITGSDGKSAAAGLAPLLADEDKAVKRAAIISLGRISPEGAATIAETMAKMIDTEKETDMRIELVTSIGLLGEKSSAVVTALTALLTSPDDELRRRVVRTLGTFGTSAKPAADTLYKLAGTDKLKDIRVDAVRGFGSAIGPVEEKARVKDLVALLIDPEYEVRLAVVEEIGALGMELLEDQETIKALRVRESDPHPKVRDAAKNALAKIHKKPEPKKEP